MEQTVQLFLRELVLVGVITLLLVFVGIRVTAAIITETAIGFTRHSRDIAATIHRWGET